LHFQNKAPVASRFSNFDFDFTQKEAMWYICFTVVVTSVDVNKLMPATIWALWEFITCLGE
jgi:hypothetical protein